jgi:hypothetical protein
MVITRRILGLNKVFFLGQEKSISSLNKMNYGTEQCDFLGQEKLILGHNNMNYGT